MKRTYSEAPSIGERAAQWWREFCDPVDGDAATRARLRRCRSALEALSITPAVLLARRCGVIQSNDQQLDTTLGLARVLAHVKTDDGRRPMRVAGFATFPTGTGKGDGGGERPLLSESRFRRLMLAQRGEEQVLAFIRLVDLLGGQVSLAELANAFWWWNDRTKRSWAFDYYAAAEAAPVLSTSLEETE